MTAFSPTAGELVAAVDREVETWLAAKERSLTYSDALIAEMRRLIAAGGKRLRPSFCYWGYRAAGGTDHHSALRAAASLELLHTFAIVHDDIMDSSDERRGEPTSYVLHGTSVALLVGDLALVLADDMFIRSGFPAPVVADAFRAYSRMREQVIVGQYLDVVAAREPTITEQRARSIARLKSGRYSIEEPLAIGATLARARPVTLDALAAYGGPLGEAFQLRDDLLGLFGRRAETGKPIDSDVREGKRNVLFARAAASLDGDDRAFFLDHWGKGEALTEEQIDALRALVERSGARAYTERLLDDLVAQANDALAGVDADAESRAALEDLTTLATARIV